MYPIFKRFLDILFSFILLAMLSPLLVVVSLLIWMKMGRPIFFTQTRTGMNNRSFEIIKFRTMSNNPAAGNTDAQRITKLGRMLRKTSIDEFPQLINILKGDMSFIGPRPLLPKYVPYYNKREIRRHEVRPGMSGLGQVNGRSYLNWEQQFEYDVEYVERLSFLLDVEIFFKTIPKVLGSADMMIDRRIDNDSFDIHRQKQLQNCRMHKPPGKKRTTIPRRDIDVMNGSREVGKTGGMEDFSE